MSTDPNSQKIIIDGLREELIGKIAAVENQGSSEQVIRFGEMYENPTQYIERVIEKTKKQLYFELCNRIGHAARVSLKVAKNNFQGELHTYVRRLSVTGWDESIHIAEVCDRRLVFVDNPDGAKTEMQRPILGFSRKWRAELLDTTTLQPIWKNESLSGQLTLENRNGLQD